MPEKSEPRDRAWRWPSRRSSSCAGARGPRGGAKAGAVEAGRDQHSQAEQHRYGTTLVGEVIVFRDLGGEKRDDGGRSDESKTGSNDAGRIKRRTTIAFGSRCDCAGASRLFLAFTLFARFVAF